MHTAGSWKGEEVIAGRDGGQGSAHRAGMPASTAGDGDEGISRQDLDFRDQVLTSHERSEQSGT